MILTGIELIRAHQATLKYLNSNLPFERSGLGTREFAGDRFEYMYWTPFTPWGQCHLQMIATAIGRPINCVDIIHIRLYYLEDGHHND